MDAIWALREVASCLEQEQAPAYKAMAFRRAADAAQALGPTDLERLWRLGRLRDVPGVGATTAAVIAEVFEGIEPTYLVALRQRAQPWPAGAAGDLLRRLVGDCHTHSEWSDGGAPIEHMAREAIALGRSYIVLTDHSPRLTVAHGLDAGRLRLQLQRVGELNEALAPFRILTGIEVDILEDGSLDQDPDLLAQLDVVVASVHSKLRMEPAPMTARMVKAVQDPNVDILGHCTGRIVVGRGRPPSSFDVGAVFSACAGAGTAVEINSRPERLDPPDELLEQAKAAGCRFAVDSDAHAPGQLRWLRHGCEKAANVGIDAGSVVNCLQWPELLKLTRA
jgi:putative hydrolase